MSDARFETSSRLVVLLDHLDRGLPLSYAKVCELTGVQLVTAKKYVDWLKEHRSLYEERENGRKVWRKVPGDDDAPDVARAAALAFAVQALEDLRGTEHFEQLEALKDAAHYRIEESARPKLEALTRTFQVQSAEQPSHPDRPAFVRTLLSAIQDRRFCRIEYHRRYDGASDDRIVQPWGMVLYRGRLLLLAGKPEQGKRYPSRRTYEVDGIRAVERLERRFTPPPESRVDYGKMFEHSFGIYTDWRLPPEDVVLEVEGPHAVALQNRRVHASQQQRVLESGRLEVSLRVIVCPELRSFIRGMIPHVIVREPASLREAIAQDVRDWLAR